MEKLSRAAILPFPGDPFLLYYWLSLFEKYWKNEITTLYIYFNSPIEKPVVDYVHKLCLSYPQIKLIYNPVQIDHGDAINRTLDLVKEEYLMLIEDDGFIFKSGQVDWCFKQLEENDQEIVGSKRGSCHTEILKQAQKLWGLSYVGEGDQGPNFWPNFLFCKTKLLYMTDRNFCGKAWKKGEVITPLNNYVVQNDIVYSDTFVNTSLQLHALVPENFIIYVPQYHGHPDDYDHFKQQRYLFDGKASWCHIGSLSSGVGGLLTDDKGRSLTRRLLDVPKVNDTLPNYCNSDFERREFERRVQWWQKFAMFWNGNCEGAKNPEMNEFWFLYTAAVDRIIVQYKLNRKNIAKRHEIYATLGL